MTAPLLDVAELCVRFETRAGIVRAVDGVSFAVEAGETLGLVGESGSGKSVTALALLGLVPSPPGVVAGERAHFCGRDLLRMNARELRAVRGKEIAMVFQDPMSALHPLLTIGRQLTEVLEVHENATRAAALRRAHDALADVGIPDPGARLAAFPHELSGGMRQRVLIAMALLCKPKLLLADEPTTALDVTIQAQILELFRDLQRKHDTAIVLITHSLGIVAGTCDRVNVMYAGRIVETATTRALFARPCHPYTAALQRSVPRLDGDPRARLASIPGSPPDLARLGAGCAFEPRCAFAHERCVSSRPALDVIDGIDEGSRRSACFVAPALAAGHAPRMRAREGECP